MDNMKGMRTIGTDKVLVNSLHRDIIETVSKRTGIPVYHVSTIVFEFGTHFMLNALTNPGIRQVIEQKVMVVSGLQDWDRVAKELYNIYKEKG